MRKAGVLSILFVLVLFDVAVIAQAQQPKKIPLIGYLSNTDPATESTRAEGIRLALRERGYVEGPEIASEYRYAEGKLDRLPELAVELVRLKVDIIVVAGDRPILGAWKRGHSKFLFLFLVGLVVLGLPSNQAEPPY